MRGTLLFLALILAGCGQTLPAQTVTGPAVARDGDSLEVGGRRVRLYGVDAPELNQQCQLNGKGWSCGYDARDTLRALVDGKIVSCQQVTIDQHQRVVGRCKAGDIDINRMMVLRGYAVAYRHYSSDYVEAENAAKAAKRGLWAGTFEAPDQYRIDTGVARHPWDANRARPSSVSSRTAAPRAGRPAASAPARRGDGCVIKGNINRKGEWIYHMPGMPYYEDVRPERIFCNEAAAQKAGFRRAIVRP